MWLQEMPEDVAHEILLRMSTRDAVRSAAICQSWRYHWRRLLTDVAFDRSYSPMAIDCVLGQISAPLEVFCLVTEHLRRVNGWILWVSRRAERMRLLYIWADGDHFTISPSIFSGAFRNLAAVKLVNCHLPQIAIGNVPEFKNLKDLELCCVTFSDNGQLEVLLSGCPVLETLTLIGPHNAGRLRVPNETLKILKLSTGDAIRVQFLKTVFLTKMRIFLAGGVVMGLKELFENVFCTGTLELGSSTIEVLSRGWLECTTLSADRFVHLVKLKLELSLVERREVRLMMSLMKIAPNVKCLKFYGYFAEEANYHDMEMGPSERFWRAQRSPNLFVHLERVDFHRIHFQAPEMKFIRFILGSAVNLRKLRVTDTSASTMQKKSVFRELQFFEKASPYVEIKIDM